MANLLAFAMVNHTPSSPRNPFMSQIPRSLVLAFDFIGGGSSLLRTRLRTDFPVKQGKNRENLRFRPILALLDPATTLKSNCFFFKFPKQQNSEFFQRNRELNPQNRELSGGSGNRRTGLPLLWIREPHPPLFKKPRISAAD
jgi:hypothetical protein